MAEELICTVCGAKNNPDVERCTSCGARIEAFDIVLTDEEIWNRRHQQDTFVWKWVGISFLFFILVDFIVMGLLPKLISDYDPQGLWGLFLTMFIWFAGGTIISSISPGKTFWEPTLAALIAVGPAMFLVSQISNVYVLSIVAYSMAGVLSVTLTLFGALFGEIFQYKKSGNKKV